jgi:toxin ParE1/3/4
VIVRVTSAAQSDIADGLEWYRSRLAGLDQRFLSALDAAFDPIAKHPELGSHIEGEVRRFLLHGFPYGVFYLIEPTEVVVLACLHGARDPKGWPTTGAA